MSFAEGFTQGFNMVDSAIARRNGIEMEKDRLQMQKDRMAVEDKRYADSTARQAARDAITDEHWNKDDQFRKSESEANTDYKNKSLDIQGRTLDAQIAHQHAIEGISARNANINAATAAANIAESNAKLESFNYDLHQKKRQDAAARLQTMLSPPDPKTGDVTVNFSADHETARKQMDDMSLALGMDVRKFYNKPDVALDHVNVLKNAVSNPAFETANKPQIVDSLNYLYDKEIHLGVGSEYQGGDEKLKGGVITSKRIIDYMPVNDAKGNPAGITPVIQSTVKAKDGKEYQAIAAPMTVNRASDPNDPIKIISHQDLLKKIDGAAALGSYVTMNPAQAKYINNMVYGSDAKGAKAAAEIQQTQIENQQKQMELEYMQKHGVKMGSAGGSDGITVSSDSYGRTHVINKNEGTASTFDGKEKPTVVNLGIGKNAQQAGQAQPQAVQQSAPPTQAPPQAAQPKIGERRIINGVSAIWDGRGWDAGS